MPKFYFKVLERYMEEARALVNEITEGGKRDLFEEGGVFIPGHLYDDQNTSCCQRYLYAYLFALGRKEGYCSASNKDLGKIMRVHERTIQKWIWSLKGEGRVVVEIGFQHKRKIWTPEAMAWKEIMG
jgi:hypothetical protein